MTKIEKDASANLPSAPEEDDSESDFASVYARLRNRAIEAFQNAVPGCEIDPDGAAFKRLVARLNSSHFILSFPPPSDRQLEIPDKIEDACRKLLGLIEEAEASPTNACLMLLLESGAAEIKPLVQKLAAEAQAARKHSRRRRASDWRFFAGKILHDVISVADEIGWTLLSKNGEVLGKHPEGRTTRVVTALLNEIGIEISAKSVSEHLRKRRTIYKKLPLDKRPANPRV